MHDDNSVVPVITWIAALVAVLIALVIPMGYYMTGFSNMAGQLETEAEINSRIISGLIGSNPEHWRYEQMRLEELLSFRPRSREPEIRRIIDLDGRVVAESLNPLNRPLRSHYYDVKDAGVTVARIEISRSLSPLLIQTSMVAVLGGMLGLAVFIVLRVLPLRVVKRAEQALREANRKLQDEIAVRRQAEEDVRFLNEKLEMKVTERTAQLVAAQEELVRKEKLAFLGQLGGSIGHELRNPLGVMSNAVYFLKTVLPDAGDAVREYLDIIRQEIDKSLQIISDLLDFARTKTSQRRLAAIVEIINDSLVRCAIPDNVALRVEFPERFPLVSIDPVQMGQVLHNLLTNAVQSMPGGGMITLIGEEDRDAGEVRVIIIDTGEGISPDNTKMLFQPLYSTRARGIGLGLATVKILMEGNGGRIEVSSRQGEGTKFTLILPIAGEERWEQR